MKCINKDCNSRISIAKKSNHWQEKTCKCKIVYNIYNTSDFFQLYICYYIENYKIISSISSRETRNHKNISYRSKTIFTENSRNNNFIINAKNIRKKLKSDLEFCKKYIDNLIFI